MSGFVFLKLCCIKRQIRIKQSSSINLESTRTYAVSITVCTICPHYKYLEHLLCDILFYKQVFKPVKHNQHSDFWDSSAEKAMGGCQVSQKTLFVLQVRV